MKNEFQFPATASILANSSIKFAIEGFNALTIEELQALQQQNAKAVETLISDLAKVTDASQRLVKLEKDIASQEGNVNALLEANKATEATNAGEALAATLATYEKELEFLTGMARYYKTSLTALPAVIKEKGAMAEAKRKVQNKIAHDRITVLQAQQAETARYNALKSAQMGEIKGRLEALLQRAGIARTTEVPEAPEQQAEGLATEQIGAIVPELTKGRKTKVNAA